MAIPRIQSDVAPDDSNVNSVKLGSNKADGRYPAAGRPPPRLLLHEEKLLF